MSAPVTRNSETEKKPSLKRHGSPSGEAEHLHNCTPKKRMQAKPNSSHNMSIMLWLQPFPYHPQNIKSPFSTINTAPRWKGQIQPHHSQHPQWRLFKRACAAQSVQHSNLKAKAQVTASEKEISIPLSILTQRAHQPLKHQFMNLEDTTHDSHSEQQRNT